MTLENRKIRQIILAEHDALRTNLRSIEALLDDVSKGNTAARDSAHQHFGKFLQMFLHHIAHEEEILRPVLEVIDAWGPARIATMDEEHATQRGVVNRLATLKASEDAAGWVAEVRAFIDELLVDMAGEEKTCLSPNVLRDDIIAVDADSE